MQNLNPARIVVTSFAIVILTGALLLMLPIASRDGQVTPFLTCLFTATSSTCVTGLIMVDTWVHWTLFGQIVIILMIQLGGLGFMTVITLASFALRRRIGLSERLFIPQYGALGGIWRGIFHSISAFCNAGFDLLGNNGAFTSLLSYNGNPVVLLTIMSLIVIGGLGFFVWEDIFRHWRQPRSLSLYTKMVLLLTGALIVGGALFFLAVEWDNPATLGEMPLWKKILNGFFQSVTLRTAGFDSIGQGGLRDSSLAMSCILMLIGGSSGSTAGGLKTATVGILLLTIRATLAGRSEVTLRGRAISHSRVMDAMTLTMIVLILFLAGSMVISVADGEAFLPAAFETASAMGTVGVTTGITPGLSAFSHVFLITMMFLGRVGIMSFSVAFLARSRPAKLKYPTVEFMVG